MAAAIPDAKLVKIQGAAHLSNLEKLGLTGARVVCGDAVWSLRQEGRSYDLTGKVVNGSIERRGDELRFEIRDRDGTASVPVVYTGVVPDPFRDGREVIVSGELNRGTFVAERDSLVTKCPSKFTEDKQSS